MSHRSRIVGLGVLALPLFTTTPARGMRAPQQRVGPLPTIAERTLGLERHDGFLPYYFNDENGELLLEVGRPAGSFLYVTYVTAGGLRGISDTEAARLVHFEWRDRRLLLVQENTEYRASSTLNPGLDQTVRESVPTSVLWAFPIVARDGERMLVQAGDFLFRQGTRMGFRLARDRSSLAPEHSGAFPDNTDLEVQLTLVSDPPAPWPGPRPPDPRAVTGRERHSFFRLPPPGFRPRNSDPRVGLAALAVWDFDQPPETGFRTLVANHRWRLEKRIPEAPLSEPVEPLIVYLEEGIPRAYREAFRDGVLYWSRALEAAGFRDAIQVRDLPPDASPLDHRYPIVLVWGPGSHVAVGMPVSDPRTGEALKATVFLGSDMPLYAYRDYTSVRATLGEAAPPFETLLQQQARWYAAHEFGHVLGVRHNYASPSMVSTPMPWLDVGEDGRLVVDPGRLFPPEPFAYDRWVMRYQFTPFASVEEERDGLAAIVDGGLGHGLQYLHENMWSLTPLAAQGAHGEDPLDLLERESAVRRLLLDSFDEDALSPGDPPELLFERLVPVYFRHRYALGATVNDVCGLEFAHARSGDGEPPPRPIAASVQRRALAALTGALEPGELAIPERAIALIPPRHPDYKPFELEYVEEPDVYWPLPAFVAIETSPDGAFDPLAWARALGSFVIDPLMTTERLGRCSTQHAIDSELPSVSEVLGHLVNSTWVEPDTSDPMAAALQREPQRIVLDGLLALAQDSTATPAVRSSVLGRLIALRNELSDRIPTSEEEADHLGLALRDMDRVLGRVSGEY